MEIQNFLSIAIIGAGLAMVIQFIKNHYGLDTNKTKAMTLALAIVIGAGYYFLSQTIWWQTILGVLASASTVWALLIKGNN